MQKLVIDAIFSLKNQMDLISLLVWNSYSRSAPEGVLEIGKERVDLFRIVSILSQSFLGQFLKKGALEANQKCVLTKMTTKIKLNIFSF